MAHRLLDQAEEASLEAPAEADRLAALALAIGQRLPPFWPRVEREAELGRERRVAAEGLRRRGELEACEATLRQAREHFEILPVGGPEWAGYCRSLARLGREQELDDEALALMAWAVERYGDLGDRGQSAGCRLELGWWLLEEMEVEEARRHFERLAREGAIAEADFGPWLSLRQGLAYVERGEAGAAWGVLEEVARGAADRPRRDRLRAQLIEASVVQRLNAVPEAEALLEGAWEGLLEEGESYEALLALVELVELLAEQGRGAEIEALAERLPVFGGLPEPVLEGVRFSFAFAVVQGPAAGEQLESLRVHLRRVRYASPAGLPRSEGATAKVGTP